MVGGRTAGRLARIVMGLVWGIVLASSAARSQSSDEAAALNVEVVRLYKAGKYAEATEKAKQLIAIREKVLGPEHPSVGSALNNLAELYSVQGLHAEAERLFKRSLSVYEMALGPDHTNAGNPLNNLAGLYQAQGRYAEAEPLFTRSLAIGERALGPEHPDVATSLNNLAGLYQAQGRYPQAELFYKRCLAVRQKVLGSEHQDVGASLNNLAGLYRDQGRYAEAEPLYKRSLTIWEKALGPEHPDMGRLLNNLALLYEDQGRYADAEPLFKRSLTIWEKALGREHPSVATSLNNLAGLYQAQGRYTEAEALYKRSFAVMVKALGAEHPSVATSLHNLVWLYETQGRFAEAEALLKRSLAIREKALGLEHPDVATSLTNAAYLYQAQRRYAEAEPLLKRSLAIEEKALGPEHPKVAASLNNLAHLHQSQGRYAEAQSLYKRSLAIHVKALGPEHPTVITSLSNMAWLAYDQSDWTVATEYWRRSTDVMRRRAERGFASGRTEASGQEERRSGQFRSLIKATYRLAQHASGPTAPLSMETFETAQWAQGSKAATSLTQMAARSAKGLPQLAELVRERQDLVSEWQLNDKLLIAAKSEAPAKRKADAETALAGRLAAIDIRLGEIDLMLARDFPDYAAMVNPASVSVAEVQSLLGADEALVLFLDTPVGEPLPEESFIWFVTKTDARWVRSDLGTAALAVEVAALRCGLDATAWYGHGAEKCAQALSIPLAEAPGPNQPLPFDHGRAHKLYAALFGEGQDLVNGKHLLIVPSGPLTQLPFQVLVTKPPSGDHRAVAWLTREHAITVLPAVSSLKALRRVGKPSTAPRPMIGFGNPLLDGPDGGYEHRANLARERQLCPEPRGEHVAALANPRGGVSSVEKRGGLADVSLIKMQVPLPETADELCAVARDVKAEARDVRLGSQATEREIKRLSASGELAKYRMLHFATHGVIAGQLDGTQEPGLILTPPDKATEEDDGYLSASEIAALKLDANWVILSACNTATGAATSAEALSGLARAFIYAQARALLVSHWEVYSDATVKLITTAVRAMARDPKVGRAEAMRRSMLALIDKGEPQEAHPAYWAPFVVVGEGAAARQ
jgi:CHAT domain-containing protein/tetratricopeptide (TPR) repeat protein